MPIPISNVTRRVVYAASGTGPYAFTFEILANTDIAVYKDDALLTLTTDYTVTIASNGTGSITLVASPTGATQIAIVGNRTIQRTTDFVTGGDFFANTVNDEMDQQTIFAQQNAEGLQRALSAPQTDPTSINMTLPRASLRANKALGFDANGNPAIADTLGTNRGNWSSGVLYYVRDIIKDTTNSNIWQCIVQHTSSGSQPISTNADVAKWSLLVDAAAAATSATNAAASASAASTSASNASTSASNASSSASTASTQASNASTSATNAASSASAASSSATTASTAATNAGNSATAAATSATNASNSASAASTSASNASSSASAASTSASNASTSATNAASSASTATTQATNASNSASTASTQATNAASSATAAAASATSAAASYDSFDDRYLGVKSSNPTLDNDGNALLTGAIYFNSVANTMRVYNGTAWQDQAASPDTIAERSFAATAGQTSYTFTGGYRVGYTYVYVNGALLDTADITATDGTTITFTSALALNDEVRILSYKAIGSVAIGDISGLQTALDGKVAGAAATTTVGGDLKLYEGTNNGTNYVAFKAPDTIASNVTWTLPSADGTSAQVLSTNGSGTLSWATSGGGSGDVVGPASATANGIALFDGTTGKLIKDSAASDGLIYGLTVGRGVGAVATNTVVGASALVGSNTGGNNTVVGSQAMLSNTSGNGATAIGRNSMQTNSTGTDSTAVGRNSLFSNTTGSNNVAIGKDSLYTNTTASNNTAVGYQACYTNTTGSEIVALGHQSAKLGSTGSGITAIGNNALLNNTASNNTAVGGNALNANTTGTGNVAVGNGAFNSTNGALGSNTTGSSNTALGMQALLSNTTASNNTAVGYQAGYTTTVGNTTSVGYRAGYLSTTGGSWVAVGNESLYSNTTGSENTSIGSAALFANTTGGSNVAVGRTALFSNSTGSNHTAVGYQALYNHTGAAQGSTALGYTAGSNLTSGTNGVFIGSNAQPNAATDTNELVIGTPNTTGKGSNTGFIVAYNGSSYGGIYQGNNSSSWSTTSDQRIKKNVVDVANGLSVITALRPVEFDYKENDKHEVGFIAQEFQQVLPDQIIYHAPNEAEKEWVNDEVMGIQPNLIPYLVKAIQELKAEFDAYKLTHP